MHKNKQAGGKCKQVKGRTQPKEKETKKVSNEKETQHRFEKSMMIIATRKYNVIIASFPYSKANDFNELQKRNGLWAPGRRRKEEI